MLATATLCYNSNPFNFESQTVKYASDYLRYKFLCSLNQNNLDREQSKELMSLHKLYNTGAFMGYSPVSARKFLERQQERLEPTQSPAQRMEFTRKRDKAVAALEARIQALEALAATLPSTQAFKALEARIINLESPLV